MEGPGRPPDRVFWQILERAVDPYVLMAPDGTITWTSESITELLGYRPDELIGTSAFELLDESSRDVALLALGEVIREQEMGSFRSVYFGTGIVFMLRTKRGELLPCETSVGVPIRTGLDDYVVQIRRAEARSQLVQTIEGMAEGRPITDLLLSVARMTAASLSDLIVEIAVVAPGDADPVFVSSGPIIAGCDPDLAAKGPWMEVVRDQEQRALEVADLDPEVAQVAIEHGRGGCWMWPVRAARGVEASGAFIAWSG